MRDNITLDEIASNAMVEKGFQPDFPPEAKSQTAHNQSPASPTPTTRDLRHLLWVSIDNDDSLDLDQLTYAEPNKIFIAVADVDALIHKNSPLDLRAQRNTTSVYTPTKVFPMLPTHFSNDLTSLNQNADRCAIVIEIDLTPDGLFQKSSIYPALVTNKAKLTYNNVGNFLENNGPFPDHLKEQLLLQDRLAQSILRFRQQKGTLEFAETQLQAIIQDGEPVRIEKPKRNRAHRLIENYMIAANISVARFLRAAHFPTIYRIVKTPKRWDRIVKLAKDLGTTLPPVPDPKPLRLFLLQQQQEHPDTFPDLSLAIIKLLGRGEYVACKPNCNPPGHFDLAEHEYTHSTAPNRRYPDLLLQRLLKAALLNHPSPYSFKELSHLATHCTQKELDADKLQRRLIKCAAAYVVRHDIGKTFPALVTGSSPKGTWVRVFDPPIEGKLVKGYEQVDVADKITVKLLKVDIHNGHIDFARA